MNSMDERIDYERALAEAAEFLHRPSSMARTRSEPIEMRGDWFGARFEAPYPMPALDPARG